MVNDKAEFSAKVIFWCVIGIILTFIIGFSTGEIKVVEKEVDYSVHPINYEAPFEVEK